MLYGETVVNCSDYKKKHLIFYHEKFKIKFIFNCTKSFYYCQKLVSRRLFKKKIKKDKDAKIKIRKIKIHKFANRKKIIVRKVFKLILDSEKMILKTKK